MYGVNNMAENATNGERGDAETYVNNAFSETVPVVGAYIEKQW